MTTAALSTTSRQVDTAIQPEAAALVDETHDRQVRAVTVTLDDGDQLTLTPGLAAFVVDVVHSIAADGTFSATTVPEELTTTVAAELIGVSRPTLMKMIARDELPIKRVESHARLRRSDVLAFSARRLAERAEALGALREAEDAMN